VRERHWHRGHGSQTGRATRPVASAKVPSELESDATKGVCDVTFRPHGRAGTRRPCGALRGGNRVPLSHQQRVAGQRHRDVMVPTHPTSTLKVIQTQFGFQFLVHSLRTPSLFERTHSPFPRPRDGQRGEMKMQRAILAVPPFDHQPLRVALGVRHRAVIGDPNTTECCKTSGSGLSFERSSKGVLLIHFLRYRRRKTRCATFSTMRVRSSRLGGTAR
jgi:hypothetical protein